MTRDPGRSRLALVGAAHHGLPRHPGGARERARARGRDERVGAPARPPERDRAADRRRRHGLRGRARAREGRAARPARARGHRRARPDVGGTFELESQPGGPTTLKLTLPRWEPLTTDRADLGSLGGVPDREDRLARLPATARKDKGGSRLLRLFPLPPHWCRRPVADPGGASAQEDVCRLRQLRDALAERVRLVGVVPYLALNAVDAIVVRSRLALLCSVLFGLALVRLVLVVLGLVLLRLRLGLRRDALAEGVRLVRVLPYSF